MNVNIDVCVKSAIDKKLNVYFIATADKQTHVDVRAVVPANPGCNCYSVAKAYTALGVGICYDRGLLAPETTVGKVLGKYFTPAVDEKWRDVTVDRLLRHRSGVKDCLLDIDVLDASKFDTTDYLQIVLSQKIADASGEYFRYTDDVYYLLSRIICEASGQNLTDLLRRPLMEMMKFKELAWSVCPRGYALGGTGLYLRTEDMVKLGALYLRGGDWNGTRVVSEEWVRLSVENCYGFDSNNNGLVVKGGMRGQVLAIDFNNEIAYAYHGFGSYKMADVIID